MFSPIWIFGLSTLLWILLWPLLKLVRPQMSAQMRYDVYHALAYGIIVVVGLLGVIQLPDPWSPRTITDNWSSYAVISFQLGFFIGGAILFLLRAFPWQPTAFVHHIFFGVLYSGMLLGGKLIVMMVWLVCIQITGIFYHLLRLRTVRKPQVRWWLNFLHTLTFLAVRVGMAAWLLLYGLWQDLPNPLWPGWPWRLTTIVVILVYASFHLYWAKGLRSIHSL